MPLLRAYPRPPSGAGGWAGAAVRSHGGSPSFRSYVACKGDSAAKQELYPSLLFEPDCRTRSSGSVMWTSNTSELSAAERHAVHNPVRPHKRFLDLEQRLLNIDDRVIKQCGILARMLDGISEVQWKMRQGIVDGCE